MKAQRGSGGMALLGCANSISVTTHLFYQTDSLSIYRATCFDLKLGHQGRNKDSSVVLNITFRHSCR